MTIGDDVGRIVFELLSAAADGVLLAIATVAQRLLGAGLEAAFLGIDGTEVTDILDGGGGDEGFLGRGFRHGFARPGSDEDLHAFDFFGAEGALGGQAVGEGTGGQVRGGGVGVFGAWVRVHGVRLAGSRVSGVIIF